MTIDCASCHTTDSWELEYGSFAFNHDSTAFSLTGQHAATDCRQCHTSLVFSEAPTTCVSCHTDMHQQTVGTDCVRCHTTASWLVNNITELHQEAAFPLVGAHASASCFDCHQSDTELRFDPLGTDCITCHREDYQGTTNPDHTAAGYSTDCMECHNVFAFDWSSDGFNHNFFPLEKGHDIADCARCHTGGDFTGTSAICFSCHQPDFEATTNPDHQAAGISNDCAACHTTDPDWNPAEFREHDGLYFPIYSGAHAGAWNQCAECHTTPDDFTIFSCVVCHTNPDTDEEHDGVQGYVYENTACLACHPTGDADGVFDHGNTDFPLTGAHIGVDCISCHAEGYAGTSTLCADCHTPDYQGAVNPDHQALNLSMDCASCHTTDPDWNPAAFPDHDNYYALVEAHALIANDCAACHNGDYLNTPNTCFGCHAEQYNNTIDPDHVEAQFSTDCASCHNQSAWTPATFDHDAQFFPIYSGAHAGTWDQCAECHSTPGDYTVVSCTTCHTNPETDEQHPGVNGYIFSDPACLACHPTGDADNLFDHASTDFPLTGAHIPVDCISCHASGFEGTSTACAACHTPDYEQATNPNHVALGLPTDCAACHTTEPEWNPASFAIHDEFYVLSGAHAAIANDCVACHAGDYVNTPATCFGCHSDQYNQTTNPNHAAAQFNTDCAACHNETNWIPATFDHDGQYFPIYSGDHEGEWGQCIECHTNPANYADFTCVTCHTNPETDDAHLGINGYAYNSQACFACHPMGNADMAFDHNNTAFPLTGAHTIVDCVSCHASGYAGTSTQCVDCHQADYDQATNPNHIAAGFATDCAACHTTEPDWMPAAFPDHDNVFPLTGAHGLVASDCAACHGGDYVNTPSTCVGCHQADYDQSMNPDHDAIGIPTDCASCHTTDPEWNPATFPIHDAYYALNGAHALIANDCVACHGGDYTSTPSTCVGCHQADYNQTVNPDHTAAQFSTDCAACHSETAWVPSTFDHDAQYFPIFSGDHEGEWSQCVDCHTNPSNYAEFTCVTCHSNPETDNQHAGVNGYMFNSNACLGCHPTGDADLAFDHAATAFPLTGAHTVANCVDCHAAGYAGTPTDCFACHQNDFNQTTNPNHLAIGIGTDCASCHTTEPTWSPAAFPDHNNYYALTGAHAAVANDCAACHAGDYNNTPTDCAGCHQADYDQTINPDHAAIGIGTDCASCHTTDPTWSPAAFPIHDNYFALTGAHGAIANDCAACHAGDYNNTPNTCAGCHQSDYDVTTNPDHTALSLPIDCAMCHTTDPDWNPATFPIHDNYYPLNGAHAVIANDCAACHAGDYNNTPNTCFGCHANSYNQTTNPNHSLAQFPTDCASCHTETAWVPSTFDHDAMYFPIYSGRHEDEWTTCSECHPNPNDFSQFTCITCHTNPETDDAHEGVPNYMYNSPACFSCHPTGED